MDLLVLFPEVSLGLVPDALLELFVPIVLSKLLPPFALVGLFMPDVSAESFASAGPS